MIVICYVIYPLLRGLKYKRNHTPIDGDDDDDDDNGVCLSFVRFSLREVLIACKASSDCGKAVAIVARYCRIFRPTPPDICCTMNVVQVYGVDI